MNRTVLMLCVLFAPSAVCGEDTAVKITPDVVYGHKFGLALTMDVCRPVANANGAGVLFMVSGGWYSNWAPPEKMEGFYKSLTEHGFTVFLVRHGSSPKFSIPEAVSDVRRSVRFIRKNAAQFQVDPNRLGVYGMSAGGHLSLVLGTTADEGKGDDADPIETVSDRVQAVVAFVAPTDLRIMVREAKDRLPAYDRFPALELELSEAEKYSPLTQVSSDDAPSLLLAGDKDDLVPVDHSRRIRDAFGQHQVPCELVEFPGAGHGLNAEEMKSAQQQMVAWFQKHLMENSAPASK